MQHGWHEGHSSPDPYAEVDNESLDEELVGTTVHEVEEPLLSGLRSMVPDVTSCKGRLLVEVLFTVPCSVLSLGHAKAFSVDDSHVLRVAELVVSQATTYTDQKISERFIHMSFTLAWAIGSALSTDYLPLVSIFN